MRCRYRRSALARGRESYFQASQEVFTLWRTGNLQARKNTLPLGIGNGPARSVARRLAIAEAGWLRGTDGCSAGRESCGAQPGEPAHALKVWGRLLTLQTCAVISNPPQDAISMPLGVPTSVTGPLVGQGHALPVAFGSRWRNLRWSRGLPQTGKRLAQNPGRAWPCPTTKLTH
jgi:hypothetical protein